MYTAYSIQYIHVPNACSDYDQSCSNEACAAGFVWGPNKWLAFVFAPVEPVEIYYVGPDRKENPVEKKRRILISNRFSF